MLSRQTVLALLGVGVSAFAFAQQGFAATTARTFSPVTSWSVSRIEPAKGGAPYCTLARRFNGNTVITFARNTAGEGTIAVDFQQPLFDPNQSYRVALQAGDGLMRQFMTRPATANAVVLRTGEDAKFFNALANSDELGVILDDVRYAFTIPDFNAGTSQLSGCIGGSAGASATQAFSGAPRSPVDDGAMNELRAQLNQLKQENASIVASLKGGANTTAQVAALPDTAENNQLTQKLARLEADKNALVEKLQTERSRQQQEAQDEQDLQKALEDQKALKFMLEAERQERAALESSLQEKTADAEKRGELRARIAALETSNAELGSLRDTLETERAKRLNAERALQDQRAAAASSLEDQERLRTRVTELEGENKSLKASAGQIVSMKAQLEDTGTRASMEQARREAAEKALQEMQLSSSERAAQLNMLQTRLETERAKMAFAESAKEAELSRKHAGEVSRLNAEIENLRVQQQMADDLAQKATVEEARRAAAEKALSEMRMSQSLQENQLSKKHAVEMARLNKEVEKLRSSDSAATAETKAKIAAAEADLRRMQETLIAREAAMTRMTAEKADLMAQMETATSQETQHRAEVGRLNAELARLRESATTESKAKIAAAEARLKAAQDSLAAREAEMTRMTAERAAMTAKMEAAGVDAVRVKEMADKLAEMEKRNTDLMTQVQTARAQTQAAEKAAVISSADTAANDAATKEKIAEIGRKAETDRREMQALLEAEKARREKLEGLMAQGGDNAARVKEMNIQMAELSKRNAEMEARLKAEQARLAVPAPAPVPDNSEQVAQLKKQLDVLKGDNQMLAEKLASAPKAALQNAPVAVPPQIVTPQIVTKTVFSGDEQMADALAETKTSLASVMAERDEYRDLLQRERLNEKSGAAKNREPEADPVTVARVEKLEAERVDLIRQLEHERSRAEQIASGREVPPAPKPDTDKLGERLAQVEKEKAMLKKQLEVTQRDIIAARSNANNKGAKMAPASSDADVQALLQENKKLQAELAASAAGGSNLDMRAMQTEIAALRAQNGVMSEEINKRLAAAPDRATMDNAAAAAEFKARQAGTQAKQAASADIAAAQNRFQAAEAENIRLARELAQARSIQAPQQQPVVPVVTAVAPRMQPVTQPVSQAAAQVTPMMKSTPVQTAAARVAAPVSSMYQPASISPAGESGLSGQDIAGYLKRAGIPMVSGFEKINKMATAQFSAFRWDTGVVFGTAEQQRMPQQGFEQAINAYLQKTRQRCSGTFDQQFDSAQMSSTQNGFAVADVACVMPDGTGAGAAMLFYYKDGIFNAIAHEGEVSQFDQAMSTRDSLARFLKTVI